MLNGSEKRENKIISCVTPAFSIRTWFLETVACELKYLERFQAPQIVKFKIDRLQHDRN